MISIANILRRLCLYALMILGPLCLAQQAHGGFPELCDQKKAEAESAEITLCRVPNPYRKLRLGVLPCHPFIPCHPFMRPSLSLFRLASGLQTLRPETFPAIRWAARSLPMLC